MDRSSDDISIGGGVAPTHKFMKQRNIKSRKKILIDWNNHTIKIIYFSFGVCSLFRGYNAKLKI